MRMRSIIQIAFTLFMASAVVMFEVPLRHAAAAIPPVERVVVYKSQKLMQLLSGNEVIRSFQVALGRNPLGHKQKAGDCRTPEGTYVIDRHNKDSRFYKSLHISYPNSQDLSAAKNNGHSPGSDIMIHGLPKGFEDLSDFHFRRNWTKGCIAVNNAEMDEIWQLVADGTPITINP
ncbi:L,D-transpeptidase-like protein [Geobacter argillaceus]|uniref:L,D-transpeptidase-like protein n=2 Tax=Geobacter argillaceus TaxID=345631 RepID=A0A562VF86_9BACT|nr:L,D-transpeptidase-like protein [Geobacter argillaceus]